jgi:preprotein translocase subunit SecG
LAAWRTSRLLQSDGVAQVIQALFTAFYILVCIVLLLVVLLQQGKGGDIASAFGGSSSQAAFGARAGANLLTRVTTVAAVLFMLSAIGLGIIWQRSPASVVGGVNLPASQSAPAKPTPAPAAPVSPAPGAPAQKPASQPPK